MKEKSIDEMIEIWKRTMNCNSYNLTSNAPLPQHIRAQLLHENKKLENDLVFTEKIFPTTSIELDRIVEYDAPYFNILAGLQSEKKADNLTFFRAIRFPTINRIWPTVVGYGMSMSNKEQERLRWLYTSPEYINERSNIQANSNFWIQPQERIVDGLPIFVMANDALQIHHAYKGRIDKTLLVVAHIPFDIIKNKQLTLVANSAIDINCNSPENDVEITDFINRNNSPRIDYNSLHSKGIYLHELYIKGLPLALHEHQKLGIDQKFYLLETHSININESPFTDLFKNTELMNKNQYFLHGFFGDHNVFGRRPAKYLPHHCEEVTLNPSINIKYI
jgi:hypothetical protein